MYKPMPLNEMYARSKKMDRRTLYTRSLTPTTAIAIRTDVVGSSAIDWLTDEDKLLLLDRNWMFDIIRLMTFWMLKYFGLVTYVMPLNQSFQYRITSNKPIVAMMGSDKGSTIL
jgi:hypothetical protein